MLINSLSLSHYEHLDMIIANISMFLKLSIQLLNPGSAVTDLSSRVYFASTLLTPVSIPPTDHEADRFY